jgi:hypothetical protein
MPNDTEIAAAADALPTLATPPTAGESAFELAQRQASALAASSLVPQEFRGNTANCMLALEFAERTGSSVFQVVQNVYVIHGRPSVSSQFIIAALNACGRFSPLRFRVTGEGMEMACVAYAMDRETGEELPGPAVTMVMAEAEGWLHKNGSKWQTMPELMIRYRAAAFFGRLYAPDILMGMRTDDEARDMGHGHASAGAPLPAPAASALEALRAHQERDVTPPRQEAPPLELTIDDDPCELCGGSGQDPEAEEPCRACGGGG